MSRVRIVSDGTPMGTKVLVDGKPLDMVTCVEIDDITGDSPVVTARLTVLKVELDLIAEVPEK